MSASKRLLRVCLILLAFSLLLSTAAWANSPPPPSDFTVYLQDLPEGAAYVDLLVKLKEDDPNYSPLEAGNLPGSFAEDAEILSYHKSGYRSYTFHYAGAGSCITPCTDEYSGLPCVRFFQGDEGYIHIRDVERRGTVKLAVLDSQGSILRVSNACAADAPSLFARSLGTLDYNGATNRLKLRTDANPSAIVLFAAISIAGLFVNCILEWIVSLFFGLHRKYGWDILCVNGISQILMRTAFVLLYGPVFNRYSHTVIVLEILVFVGEFLFYRKKMEDVSPGKCLAYTVTANAISLALGLWSNHLLL